MNSVIKIIDVILIIVLLHTVIHSYEVSHAPFLPLGFIAAVIYLLLAEVTNAHTAYYSATLAHEILITTFLWVIVVVGALVFLFLIKESSTYSRFVLIAWGVCVPITLLFWHLLARKVMGSVMSQSGKGRRAVVIGTGDLAEKVKNTLQKNAWLGFHYAGVYEDREASSRLRWEDDTRGSYEDMIGDAKSGKFDVAFIALPLEAQVRIMSLVDQFGDTTVTVYMVPDFFLSDLVKGNWHDFAGMQVMGVFDTPFWGVNSWLKRVEDIILGCLILLVISIPMLAIALAVKLTSEGPVIFRQLRYGIDGKEINILKFRSMRVSKEESIVQQAQKDDPRLTSLGKFLRETSLDELPQFFNVIAGNMSIVGPRPHAVSHNEDYRKDIRGYMLRHKVKPGITGWAQINGWRGETDTLYKMRKRIDHDLWYLDNWSLWLDIKIIVLTVFVGFTGKNAY
ncbi:MAG: putative colanic acid biosynthesis UDP-glucose lipid carrier transferase [Gammaproteobacteria bacterium]|jgi:putative colanic acid biosynthesis UDP-glucose lipid carrier transferase